MSRRARLRLVLGVVSVFVLAGGVAHSRQRYQAGTGVSATAGSQNDLVLTGFLGPNVTIPIDVPGLELTVPLNSYVEKGQVIGETRSPAGPAPAQAEEGWLSPEEADAAVAEATDGVRDAEASLEAAREQESDAGLRQAAAEVEKRSTDLRFENVDLQFREGDLSVGRYYRSLDRLASAEAAAEATRTLGGEAVSAVHDAEARLEQANNRLAEAERNRQRAYASAEQGQRAGWVEVVSPADGYVIVRDPVSNVYGIGSNDTSLRVVTEVPAEDLFRVRVGQDALVSVDALPEVTMKATIREINEAPTESATGALYTVVLEVANPQGLSFDGEPVHIRIATTSQ